MPDREFESNAPAVAEAQHIDPSNTELSQERCRVVGHLAEGEWAIDICGVAVGLLLRRDNEALGGERRQNGAESGIYRGSATMEEQQGLPLAMHLIVHLEWTNFGIAAPDNRLRFAGRSMCRVQQ